jgi:excisionase family DNA binding protein
MPSDNSSELKYKRKPKSQAKLAPSEKIAVKPSEAAELLSMDRSTFYRKVMPHVRAGRIRSMRIGKLLRIFVDSLLAWAQAQSIAA